MLTRIHWIETGTAGRLAVMARPRGGEWLEDEIRNWKEAGIDVVLSLLERDEARELELDAGATMCAQHGIVCLANPIPDRGVPDSVEAIRALATQLANFVREGRSVAIHCRAGIGRSGMVAACVLIAIGFDVEGAFAAIAQARGVPVPDTQAQRDWMQTHAGEFVVGKA